MSTEDIILRIPFSFEPGLDFDLDERLAFWTSPETSQFFARHGYILYDRIYGEDGSATDSSKPALPFQEFKEADYPFAYHDAQFGESELVPLRAADCRGKVVFAQDSQSRHLAIKLVRDATDEYHILKNFSQLPLEMLGENCIIPVLELIPTDGFWFAVMPRWGGAVKLPAANTVKEFLGLMHAMLKALAFLHANNISHGDISDGNMLVNHFCDQELEMTNTIRADLRAQGLLRYAMFDFDYSVMLPPTADQRKYRLPYERSWGTFTRIEDTAQGEFEYNPFSFDVGNMGALFCRSYQHLCREVPFLAPLLDSMTTRDLDRRFTAAQALQFFEDMTSQMTQAELETEVCLYDPIRLAPYDEFDRWKHVPLEFARNWAAYREPPIPWLTKVLRQTCRHTWAYRIIARVRWFFSRLSPSQLRLHTHFVGFKFLSSSPASAVFKL